MRRVQLLKNNKENIAYFLMECEVRKPIQVGSFKLLEGRSSTDTKIMKRPTFIGNR